MHCSRTKHIGVPRVESAWPKWSRNENLSHSCEKFSRRRVWCSELSSGLYCRVKWLSTDVSEVRTASIIRDEWAKHERIGVYTGQPSARSVVTSRSHWYHPGLSTRPFQGLNCIHLTYSPDIPLSLSSTWTNHPLPLAGSQPIVSHHDWPHRHWTLRKRMPVQKWPFPI
jgi:hypothetical protein